MSRNYPENAIQRSIIARFALMERTARRTPWAFFAFAVPNARKGNPRLGAQLKALGVRAGVADIIIFTTDGRAGGIEVKAPGGVRSPAQQLFAQDMAALNVPVYVVRSADEAVVALKEMQDRAAGGREFVVPPGRSIRREPGKKE